MTRRTFRCPTSKRARPVEAQGGRDRFESRRSIVPGLDFLQRKLVRRKRYTASAILGLAHAEYDRLPGSNLRYPEMGSASIGPTPPASTLLRTALR
jgi:hypothetical protein